MTCSHHLKLSESIVDILCSWPSLGLMSSMSILRTRGESVEKGVASKRDLETCFLPLMSQPDSFLFRCAHLHNFYLEELKSDVICMIGVVADHDEAQEHKHASLGFSSFFFVECC